MRRPTAAAAGGRPDLRRTARRWPVFTPRALGAGMAGVCAFPMRLRADRIGALNVFQATPGSFDQASVLAGQALADVATIRSCRPAPSRTRPGWPASWSMRWRAGWWSSRPRGSWPSGLGSTGDGVHPAAAPWPPARPAPGRAGPPGSGGSFTLDEERARRVSSRRRRQPCRCRELPEVQDAPDPAPVTGQQRLTGVTHDPGPAERCARRIVAHARGRLPDPHRLASAVRAARRDAPGQRLRAVVMDELGGELRLWPATPSDASWRACTSSWARVLAWRRPAAANGSW